MRGRALLIEILMVSELKIFKFAESNVQPISLDLLSLFQVPRREDAAIARLGMHGRGNPGPGANRRKSYFPER